MGNLWGTFNKNINHTNNMIDPIAMTSLAELSGNVGFGLVTIGAGLGIGLIGAKSRGSHRTQPRSFLPHYGDCHHAGGPD